MEAVRDGSADDFVPRHASPAISGRAGAAKRIRKRTLLVGPEHGGARYMPPATPAPATPIPPAPPPPTLVVMVVPPEPPPPVLRHWSRPTHWHEPATQTPHMNVAKHPSAQSKSMVQGICIVEVDEVELEVDEVDEVELEVDEVELDVDEVEEEELVDEVDDVEPVEDPVFVVPDVELPSPPSPLPPPSPGLPLVPCAQLKPSDAKTNVPIRKPRVLLRIACSCGGGL